MHDLLAQQVTQFRGRGEEERIADPFSRSYRFLQVSDDAEGGFDAVFVCGPGVEAVQVSFAVKAQDVGCFGAGEGDEFAGFTPVDLFFLLV